MIDETSKIYKSIYFVRTYGLYINNNNNNNNNGWKYDKDTTFNYNLNHNSLLPSVVIEK